VVFLLKFSIKNFFFISFSGCQHKLIGKSNLKCPSIQPFLFQKHFVEGGSVNTSSNSGAA
jgi:hypothetical protein